MSKKNTWPKKESRAGWELSQKKKRDTPDVCVVFVKQNVSGRSRSWAARPNWSSSRRAVGVVLVCTQLPSFPFYFYFLKKKNHVVEVRLNDFASGSLSISVPRLLQSVHTLNTKHLESSTIQTKTSSLRWVNVSEKTKKRFHLVCVCMLGMLFCLVE